MEAGHLRLMAKDDEKTKRQSRRWVYERIAFAAAVGLLWLAAFFVAYYL
tara:strand:+ start:111 stop:257 length:147 start_codon:yes stop_codon:yes gene_type:complete